MSKECNTLQQTVAELRSAATERFGPFLRERINPTAAERDLHHSPLPTMLLQEAADIGMFAYGLPEEVGGEGHDTFDLGITLETIGYESEDMGLPIIVGLTGLCAGAIVATGRTSLIETYVEPMLKGRRFGALAYTDGGDRSDAFSFQSTARRDGDGWVLNGSKKLISGGLLPTATFLTFVRDEESQDMLVFLVHPDDPGVSLERVLCMGVRSAGYARMKMTDVRLDSERLVLEDDGLSAFQGMMSRRRMMWTCTLVGRMQAIYERAVAALGKRHRYGYAIADFQNVQARMGRAVAGLETSRSTMFRALDTFRRNSHNPLWDPLASVARWHATEEAVNLALSLQRVLGTEAYIANEHPWERYLRDMLSLVAGGQDVVEVDLGVTAIAHYQRLHEFGR